LCKQLFIFHLFKNFISIVVNNLQTTEKQFAVYNRIVYKKSVTIFQVAQDPQVPRNHLVYA
jgi:hypothetical protein